MTHTFELSEEDRQLVLLALAVLSLENPGFDFALNEIAKKIDNVDYLNRAKMYDEFRELRRKPGQGLPAAKETKDPRTTNELMLVGMNRSEALFLITGLHNMLSELEKQLREAHKANKYKEVFEHGKKLYDRMKVEFEETFDEILNLETKG